MPFCFNCDKYYQDFNLHGCPPVWLVIVPDRWNDWGNPYKVYDYCEKNAAETAASMFDTESADHIIVGGTDVEIHVRLDMDSPIKKFMCSGESVPEYTAKEIK